MTQRYGGHNSQAQMSRIRKGIPTGYSSSDLGRDKVKDYLEECNAQRKLKKVALKRLREILSQGELWTEQLGEQLSGFPGSILGEFVNLYSANKEFRGNLHKFLLEIQSYL